MLRRKRRLRSTKEEVDPMVYAVNMVDCMLVLAVGFLIFGIMSMGMQSVVFSDASPQEKKEIMETVKKTIEVQKQQELNNTPDTSSSSGSGYVPLGQVYRDPNTGKLYLIGS